MPERELNERLAALAQDVGQAVALSPAAQVRRRGDRRRTQVLALAAVAAGVATAGTGVAVATGGGGGLPVGSGPVTTIPAALAMPHEGDPGWQRDDDPQVASILENCDGPDVTLPGRTDARTLTGRGNPVEEEHSPTTITNQLFFYRTEQDAQKVMEDLTQVLPRCSWVSGSVSDTVYGPHVLMARSAVLPGQPKTPTTLSDVIVTRRGNVIYLSYWVTTGALMSSGDYQAVEEMGRRLCDVLGLCEAVICTVPMPSPSRPAQFPCTTDGSIIPSHVPGSFDPSMYPSIDPSGPPTTTP